MHIEREAREMAGRDSLLKIRIWTVIVALIVMLMAFGMVFGDDLYTAIKKYPTPLVCKPVTLTADGVVVLGPQSTWLILPWATLESVNEEEMVFNYNGKKHHFKNGEGIKGYVCSIGSDKGEK